MYSRLGEELQDSSPRAAGWERDSNDDVQPSGSAQLIYGEAFEKDSEGNLQPSGILVSDDFWERDINGDLQPTT